MNEMALEYKIIMKKWLCKTILCKAIKDNEDDCQYVLSNFENKSGLKGSVQYIIIIIHNTYTLDC
jgi:hypothetical protein